MRSTSRQDPTRRPGRRFAITSIGVFALCAAGLAVAPPASAATLTVTSVVDGGVGSLRAAFAQASANGAPDEIVLQPGVTYTLDDCAEGDLDHTAADTLSIVGNGSTIRQTCANERVIETAGTLTVADATITGGNVPGGLGGGIEADTSTVNLTRSTVSGNQASTGGGVGAIRVTLVDSTITGNTATSTGGGIWADQTLTATNSTITANTASTAGGGVAVVNTSITLLFATVAANSAPLGANLQVQPGGDLLVSFGSVVASPAGGGAACDLAVGAATTSQGANVSSDSSCGFGGAADDLAGAGDPQLGALASNGGPTRTMLPAAGSVLLDRANCAAAPSAVVADQRGISRPQGVRCDVGAVEVVVVTTTAGGSPSGVPTPNGTTAPQGGAPIGLTG